MLSNKHICIFFFFCRFVNGTFRHLFVKQNFLIYSCVLLFIFLCTWMDPFTVIAHTSGVTEVFWRKSCTLCLFKASSMFIIRNEANILLILDVIALTTCSTQWKAVKFSKLLSHWIRMTQQHRPKCPGKKVLVETFLVQVSDSVSVYVSKNKSEQYRIWGTCFLFSRIFFCHVGANLYFVHFA